MLGLHFFVDAAQISTISLEISILWRIIIFQQHFFSIAFCPQLELCLIGKVKNLSLIHLYLFIAARCSFASFLFCFHYDSIVTAFFYSQLAAAASIPFMLSNSSSFFPYLLYSFNFLTENKNESSFYLCFLPCCLASLLYYSMRNWMKIDRMAKYPTCITFTRVRFVLRTPDKI